MRGKIEVHTNNVLSNSHPHHTYLPWPMPVSPRLLQSIFNMLLIRAASSNDSLLALLLHTLYGSIQQLLCMSKERTDPFETKCVTTVLHDVIHQVGTMIFHLLICHNVSYVRMYEISKAEK